MSDRTYLDRRSLELLNDIRRFVKLHPRSTLLRISPATETKLRRVGGYADILGVPIEVIEGYHADWVLVTGVDPVEMALERMRSAYGPDRADQFEVDSQILLKSRH